MLQELARGLLLNEPMSDRSREMFEVASHALADRVRLYLHGLTMQRMTRLPDLLSGLDLYSEYLRDPEKMKELWDQDPKMFLAAGKLLRDIIADEQKLLREDLRGVDSDAAGGFDPKKQYNVLFNLASISDAQLPDSLQDPKVLREFRSVAQAFIDTFVKGKELPQAPDARTRILDVDPSDGEVDDEEAADVD